MAYSREQKWQMFMELLKNNAHSEMRDIYRRILHDMQNNLLPEREAMDRTESGAYGKAGADLWKRFLETN